MPIRTVTELRAMSVTPARAAMLEQLIEQAGLGPNDRVRFEVVNGLVEAVALKVSLERIRVYEKADGGSTVVRDEVRHFDPLQVALDAPGSGGDTARNDAITEHQTQRGLGSFAQAQREIVDVGLAVRGSEI